MRQNRFNNGLGLGRGDGAGMGPGNGRGLGCGMGMNRGTRTCIWDFPRSETDLLNHQKTILEERLRFVNVLIEKSGKDAQTSQV